MPTLKVVVGLVALGDRINFSFSFVIPIFQTCPYKIEVQ